MSTEDVKAKGLRAAKLEEILTTSIKQTLRACSIEKLTSCFPTLARNDPDTLSHARDQVIEFLTRSCNAEFAKIIEERQAVERLNELDELVATAKRRKEAGEPPLDSTSDVFPSQLFRAHLLPIKRQELDNLNNKIMVVQQTNTEAIQRVELQRHEIDGRLRVMKEALRDLAGAADALSA